MESSQPIPVENDFRHEACPLCGAALATVGLLSTARRTDFSTHRIVLTNQPALARCLACNTHCTQNAVRPAESWKLYETGDGSKRWHSPRSFVESKPRRVSRVLTSLVGPRDRVLDIGCNTGTLLNFLKQLGADTYGVEPSEGGRRIANAAGHVVTPSLDDATGTFDLITAFDVLEHLYNVTDFFAALRARLEPNGKLVVLTGDIECWASRRYGASWWYVQYPEHVVFPSLAALRVQPGFTVESVHRTYAEREHMTSPGRHLLNLVQRKALQSLPDHVLVVLRRVA